MSDSQFSDDGASRQLAYLCAVLLVVVPFLQAGVQLWPLQLDNIQWRFGAASALSSVLLLPFLGLSLATLVARMTDRSGVARVVGALAIVFSLGLMASLALFVLDALQLKAIVRTQAMQSFQGTALRVGAVTALFIVAFLLLSVVSFRRTPGSTAKAAGRSRERAEDTGVGLIVGQPVAKAE